MRGLKRQIYCMAAVLAATVVVSAFSTGTITADRAAAEAVRLASRNIGNADPDVRAKAVEDLARANNKDGARFMMQCLATENDGPAGWRMAEAVSLLTSEEALDEVEKNVLKWNKPENLFGAYWTLLGLSNGGTEQGSKVLRKAIEDTKDRDIYIRSAALEAMAETERRDMVDLLLQVLKTYDPKWDQDAPIIALTCIQGAPRMVSASEPEPRDQVVLALADVLEKTEDDRIQWFTCKALSEITSEDTYIDPEFWRWWVKMGGRKSESRDDGATIAGRDVPKFFKAEAVGKRVVFVIDISGSMKLPVELPPEMKNPPKEEPKDEPSGPVTGGKGKESEQDPDKEPIPPPDYSKVQTKLDLAKVELIHTLTHLPNDYWFNVVVYETPHSMLDNSNKELVQATEANKRKFIKRVEGLHWANLTNIHGALVRAFGVNQRKTIDPSRIGKRDNDPGWDPECLKTGATTMFFLTDGSPTISDDSTDIGQVGRPGGPNIGNGRMVKPENIIQDVRRLNVFRKCVINTVGIGPHNGRLMGELARLSGGEYVDRSGVAPR